MHRIRHGLLVVLEVFSLTATRAPAASNENNPVLAHPAATAEPVEQHFLVKLRAPAAAAAHAEAQAIQARSKRAVGVNGTLQNLATRSELILEKSREISTGLHVLQVRSVGGEPIAATWERLRADPDVESVDLDQRRYPHAVPDDPLHTGQWYQQADQVAGTDAASAWDTSTGRSDVVIAELDTGVRFDHPDLLAASANGRLLPGYDFITNAAVANDGDGRDADASDPGDWVSTADIQTVEFSGCSVANSSWHGTRVAGILGALTNNGAGIAGMTWGPKILPLRVLGKCGGVDSDILDALRWAAGLPVAGVPANVYPADVINLSLGGQGACSSAEQTVINEVIAAGATVVVSAGNDGSTVDSPANCAGVAGIAGLRQSGTKVGFSNLGPKVALSAPGGNCANPTGPCTYSLDTTTNSGTTGPTSSGYTDQLNPNLGTSFSAPMVSGIAALMTSVNANLKSAQVIARLKEGAKAFPAAASGSNTPTCHAPASSSDTQTVECVCTTQTCGAGMANAPGALTAALRPVAAIAIPATLVAGRNVSLSGAASGAACSRSITSYAWSNVSSPNNAIQGANTATATIVAPTSGSITIKLTVTDDAGRQDSANVTVRSSSAATTAPATANTGQCVVPGVTVGPTASSVQAAGGTQTFTVTVKNSSNTAVTWYVNGDVGGNAMNGLISTAGVYTAPSSVPSPAIVTVTAVAVADTTQYASARVTINPPVAISVTPLTATVTVGTTQAFTAVVANSASTAVQWNVNGVAGGNATLGTISTAGVYTAPAAAPTPATITITAVCAVDSTKMASAQTTVAAAAATGGGTGSGSGTSSSTGSTGSGGGSVDPVTLLAATLLIGFTAYRRRFAARRM